MQVNRLCLRYRYKRDFYVENDHGPVQKRRAVGERGKTMTEKKTPLNHPKIFSHGTLECRSLDKSRPFYEEFLGLECVRHQRIAMLLRKSEYWSLVCLEVGDKVRQLGIRNHWGLDLATREEVERAHALAHEHQEKYGIQKIQKLTDAHGTYGFYFQDLDGNWWEFQYAGDGQENGEGRYDKTFEKGDIAPNVRPQH
jgi:predicted lactoylglutathione lyase